ncbi:hypothetical protein DFH27DRAFT_542352 [Peziza echinospora]|nr:hypothetical protein DFH27DRAFT_542352 [Peziza echinospora]
MLPAIPPLLPLPLLLLLEMLVVLLLLLLHGAPPCHNSLENTPFLAGSSAGYDTVMPCPAARFLSLLLWLVGGTVPVAAVVNCCCWRGSWG